MLLVISQGMTLIIAGGVLEEHGPTFVAIIRIEHDVCLLNFILTKGVLAKMLV